MSVRTAIYDILAADSPVSTEVSTRIFMTFAPSQTTIPFIVFRADMVEDTFSKDNTSTLDTYSVEIDIYHNSVAEAETLAGKVRTALLGYMGTINSVTVDGCRLEREEQDYDEDKYPVWAQDYQIRIKR